MGEQLAKKKGGLEVSVWKKLGSKRPSKPGCG